MEQAVASYVKGQFLLSLIIGVSVGVGLWLLDIVGLMPNGGKYAAAFGAWAAFTELIPYLGPVARRRAAGLYALFQHPLSALWVALIFLGIQQLEGHVVVPKVMGSSLRLHPLLVIFGLLAGGEIYGFAGILVALPLLAAGRAAWEFFSERVELARWDDRHAARGDRRRAEGAGRAGDSSRADRLNESRRTLSCDELVPRHAACGGSAARARCEGSCARRGSRSTSS